MALPSDTLIVEAFEGVFGADRLQAVVGHVTADGPGARDIDGAIVKDDNEQVGRFARRLFEADDGSLEAYGAGLELTPPFRRRGFATEFNAHAEKRLGNFGVRAIRLIAGRAEGGRAWAATFDFDDDALAGFGSPLLPGGPAGVGRGGEHVRLPAHLAPAELRVILVAEILDAAVRDGRIARQEREALRRDERFLAGHPARIATLSDGLGDDILRGARWPGIRRLRGTL